MRPTPIPDAEVWEGATRKVFAAPGGDLTDTQVAPVEALVDQSPATGGMTASVRCVLEDDDLANLQAGGTVWLTFWGGMIPWAATVVAPSEVTRREARTPDTRDCPDVGHPHRWARPSPLGVAMVVAYDVAADGTVTLSEEAMSQLLRQAGFEPTGAEQ